MKRKSRPCRESNLESPTVQPVVRCYNDPAIPASNFDADTMDTNLGIANSMQLVQALPYGTNLY
jgi:hypothetical protein